MGISNRFVLVFVFFIFSTFNFSFGQSIPSTIEKREDYVVSGSATLSARKSIVLRPNTWLKRGSQFRAYISEDSYSSPVLSSRENYIYTRVFQDSTKNGEVSANSGVIEQVVYYDGLGRAKQEVQIRGGGSGTDLVRPIYYDGVGRESRVYLPYSSTQGVLGSYRSNALGEVNTYYKTHYPYDISSSSPNPYVEKDFESSPLNRVLRESSPGASWKLGSGHEIKYAYETNVYGEVRLYKVTVNISNHTYIPNLSGGTSYYKSRELYKDIVKDEHWTPSSGKLHTVEEFKDKQGRVVLKRSYVLVKSNSSSGGGVPPFDTFGPLNPNLRGSNIGSSGSSQSSQNRIASCDTYYVYDDYGKRESLMQISWINSVISMFTTIVID